MPVAAHLARLSALALLVLAATLGRACAGDPDALWKIVHDRCVPGQIEHGDPAPCATVALATVGDKGWAVLKDREGATQFLVIPTARIAGIEDRALLAPDATNYWQAYHFEIDTAPDTHPV